MDISNSIRMASEAKKGDPAAHEKRARENSKRRLQKIVATKLTTTFIGALDKIEKHFGRYWGYDKPEEDMTEKELEIYDAKEAARKEILDLGNQQIRAITKEMELYSVSWEGYKTTFTFNNDVKEGN